MKTYILYLQLLPENLEMFYDLKETNPGFFEYLEELRYSLAKIGVCRELDSLLSIPSLTLPRYCKLFEVALTLSFSLRSSKGSRETNSQPSPLLSGPPKGQGSPLHVDCEFVNE